jgi:hypothetical protein
VIEIDLGRNYRTIVDSDSFRILRLERFKWRAQVHKDGYVYAYASHGGFPVYLHRLIAGAGRGQIVDHVNRNTLDNRLSNLRRATPAQNRANSRKQNRNTSGYKGVTRANKKWMAQIVVKGVRHYLGVFEHAERAAMAHDRAAIAAHGEFAGLNFEHMRSSYHVGVQSNPLSQAGSLPALAL